MEGTPSQYNHPPVTEAIFSVAFQEGVTLASIQRFCELDWVKENYPVATELNETTGKQSNPTPEPLGFSLRSSDGATILRFTTTRFSFHNLNTYLGWEANQSSFLAAWYHMGEHCQPPAMEYASIRYINKINLGLVPDEGLELNKYLNVTPNLPDDFPGEPGRFFLQVQTYDPEAHLEGVIWQTLLPSTNKDAPTEVLLDISVRSERNQNPSLELPDFLKQGRIFKNKLFESCITSATRALIN